MREIIYLSLHCHHQNDFCIKVGSDESHFNVSVGSDGQSHKTVPTNHNLSELRERRAVAVLNRGPSAYQPNALPLGQTGSPRTKPHQNYIQRKGRGPRLHASYRFRVSGHHRTRPVLGGVSAVPTHFLIAGPGKTTPKCLQRPGFLWVLPPLFSPPPPPHSPYTHAHTCRHARTHTQAFTRTYTRARTHTHTHTHTPRRTLILTGRIPEITG